MVESIIFSVFICFVVLVLGSFMGCFTLKHFKLTIKLAKWSGGGGYSLKFRIGVCRERSLTLTLSKDKGNEN